MDEIVFGPCGGEDQFESESAREKGVEGSDEFGGEQEDVARLEGFAGLGKGEGDGAEVVRWVREGMGDDELDDGVACSGEEHCRKLSQHSDGRIYVAGDKRVGQRSIDEGECAKFVQLLSF